MNKENLAVETVHVGSQQHDGLHLQSQGKINVMDKNVLSTCLIQVCLCA